MKILITTGIFFLLTGAQSGPINNAKNDECDWNQLRTCAVTFMGELGIKGMPEKATDVTMAIIKIITDEGFNGAKRICVAASNLRECAGSQYDTCITEEHLKQVGISDLDAKLYAIQSQQLKLVCVDNSKSITAENYDCTRNTIQSNTGHFNQCLSTYMDQIKKDPSQLCKYMQEYTECVDQPFEKSCDPVVAKIFCNLSKIQASFFTTCSIQCSKSAVLKAIKHSSDANKGLIYTKNKNVLLLASLPRMQMWLKYF